MDFSASEPSGIYWFLGSRDMGRGATGARLLHTVTQGTRTSLPCGSTMSPRGLLTRHIQLATSTDQRRAGHTDRRCQGGPGEPLPAGPTSGQTWTAWRESQTQNSTNTVRVGTGDSRPTLLSLPLCSKTSSMLSRKTVQRE